MMGVEEVLLRVVVGGGGNDYKVCILVGACAIEGGGKVKFLFCQILLDVIVLNGRNLLVDLLHLLRDYVHCCDMIVLCQQCGNTHTDIAGSCY